MTDFFEDPDSDPLNSIAPWSLDIDHLVDFDQEYSGASWAVRDTLFRLAYDC